MEQILVFINTILGSLIHIGSSGSSHLGLLLNLF
ncbi:Uncharacterised protein [Corynebacterium kutscheri]|uniref:Uncharacterized protein n=1 Tax=Corynebacterium kutscheri TaxID=35755 RepID=A0AB38VQX4_9CORY|nr:Uncharacterised protein [Corynebacterium kutscheri]VEH10849.1 Uncharacterised protein [Corynebacterium kutscheri]VEH80674.1 Uncharacterised protein [Corynebacterium kutscheri]